MSAFYSPSAAWSSPLVRQLNLAFGPLVVERKLVRAKRNIGNLTRMGGVYMVTSIRRHSNSLYIMADTGQITKMASANFMPITAGRIFARCEDDKNVLLTEGRLYPFSGKLTASRIGVTNNNYEVCNYLSSRFTFYQARPFNL